MHAGLDGGDNFICPQKLYLDLTENCNLWCRMCRDKRCVGGGEMDAGLYRRIVDDAAPYVRSWSLFNWGESLLLNDFAQRLEYLCARKRPDALVELSTNGMLLSDDNIALLRRHEVMVTVSIDSADKKTFEYIRRGGDFERITANSRWLAAAYEGVAARLSPAFYIAVQKDNQNELAAIAELARECGIRRLGCGLVTAPAEYAARVGAPLCAELEKLFNRAAGYGMFIDMLPTKVGGFVLDGGAYRDQNEYVIDTNCAAPQCDATVASNGDVYLCCNAGELVGNIGAGSFLQLWQSERYAQLRRAVNDSLQMPQRCRQCAWANRS